MTTSTRTTRTATTSTTRTTSSAAGGRDASGSDGAPCAELLGLGLGSNVGDSEAILGQALDRLRGFLGALEVAPLYRTAPVSAVVQPDFLNTVALARLAATGPRRLLRRAKELERRAGRRGGARFGPRPLDVDLLFYGELVLPGDPAELILPHPRLRQRRFVLAPLHDLRPDLRLPPDGATVRELLADLGPGQRVERIGWSDPS